MDVLKWQYDRVQKRLPSNGWLLGSRSPSSDDYRRAFPVHQLDSTVLRSAGGKFADHVQTCLKNSAGPLLPASFIQGCKMSFADDCITAAWMGHASVLVKMEGVTFLTDPVFSSRCSPVQWAGPK